MDFSMCFSSNPGPRLFESTRYWRHACCSFWLLDCFATCFSSLCVDARGCISNISRFPHCCFSGSKVFFMKSHKLYPLLSQLLSFCDHISRINLFCSIVVSLCVKRIFYKFFYGSVSQFSLNLTRCQMFAASEIIQRCQKKQVSLCSVINFRITIVSWIKTTNMIFVDSICGFPGMNVKEIQCEFRWIWHIFVVSLYYFL